MGAALDHDQRDAAGEVIGLRIAECGSRFARATGFRFSNGHRSHYATALPPRLAVALAQLPGVEVGLATATPFVLVPPYGVRMPLGAVLLRDSSLPADQALPSVFYCGADAHYQSVLQILLRAGRWFDEAGVARGRVAVVDESFARCYFPAGDAVGRRLVLNVSTPVRDDDSLEIVGVVGDVRHNGAEDRSGHMLRQCDNFFIAAPGS
ncbi:MAG: ABC transporter permease [Opitutaceae bacterium]|nr:ABC transporter permease [Opitutaceae bacterium]